jgi:glycerophosphoryl diester phosphodiesterase
MFNTRKLGCAGTVAALIAVAPSIVAQADQGRDGPRLEGRAVLPVDTFAPGPPAGANFAPANPNGFEFPLESQPVEGFSGVIEGRRPGEYLAMPDNGFGNQANSGDFLIRAYYIRPDFKTSKGGSGQVEVDTDEGEFISFRDPHGYMPWVPTLTTNPERLLTGADIDPESIQRGRNGDLWVGDEFGPWILHFDADGVLLEAPIDFPDLKAVTNKDPDRADDPVTVNNSRGLEAIALSDNGRWLTVVFEGAVIGDDPFSRRVYQYNTRTGVLTRLRDYRVTAADATQANARFVSDANALNSHTLIVIERDGGSGASANYRKVYTVDLRRTGPDGGLRKTEVVDLAAIPDPDGVSLPAIHPGDVGLGNPFKVTCESIEAIHVISHSRLLLGCDNNFPNSGRNPARADDNEFIVVKVPGL